LLFSLQVLRETFRIKQFKKDQWKVIRSIIYDKRDTAIVASTGFGKSLTFQFPPVFLNKIAIVVSPLISLCHDQVQSMLERGIKSTYFNSSQSDRKLPLRFHEFNVIYLTPDALLNCPKRYPGSALVQQHVQRIVDMDKVCLFAIDEAHVSFKIHLIEIEEQKFDVITFRWYRSGVTSVQL
jgi:superfamily II DNA helicase RecQ